MNPGENETVDLYLVVKAGNVFSVFYYDAVNNGDDGEWTTSLALFTGDNAPSGACEPGSGYLGECWALGGKGVSHLDSYWPRLEAQVIPLPPAILLLGTALLGLAGLRRIRQS